MAQIKYSPVAGDVSIQDVFEHVPTHIKEKPHALTLGGKGGDLFSLTFKTTDDSTFIYDHKVPVSGEIGSLSFSVLTDSGYQLVETVTGLHTDVGQLFGALVTNPESAFDLLFGGADTAKGSGKGDVILTGPGADDIKGAGGDDYILAGPGNDKIDGGGGKGDTLSYLYSDHAVTVVMRTGNANAGAGDLDKFKKIENVTGSALGDKLTGDKNANVLDGSAGSDVLVGGDGKDTFAFNLIDPTHSDRISDFTHGEDKLAFSGAVYGITEGSFDLIQGKGEQHATGDGPTFLFDSRSGHNMLSFDADGAGGADAIDITYLKGVTHLSIEDDFKIV